VYAVVEGGRPGPTLMFEGHTDVVTEGDREAWSVDPFRARSAMAACTAGAAPTKSGLIAPMFAARAVADEGPFPGASCWRPSSTRRDDGRRPALRLDRSGRWRRRRDLLRAGGRRGLQRLEGRCDCGSTAGAAHGAMPFQGRNLNPVLALPGAAAGEACSRRPTRPTPIWATST
jgi:hypothetical protein